MFKTYFIKLLALLKNTYIIIGGLVTSFLAPVAGIIFTAILLGIVDFIIRLTAVYKKEGLEEIKSAKMYSTIQKLVMYALLILVMHVMDIVFLQDIRINLLDHIMSKQTLDHAYKFKLSSIVAFVIVVREVKSIDENWKYALGWSFLETAEQIFIKLKTLTKTNNARKKPVSQSGKHQS